MQETQLLQEKLNPKMACQIANLFLWKASGNKNFLEKKIAGIEKSYGVDVRGLMARAEEAEQRSLAAPAISFSASRQLGLF